MPVKVAPVELHTLAAKKGNTAAYRSTWRSARALVLVRAVPAHLDPISGAL
jgi:hypothetical protein